MDISIIDNILSSVYKKEEYPVLYYQSQKWQKSKPLEGVKILDATPVFRNTLIKHRVLIDAGAELIVGISDQVPYDSKIVDILKRAGVTIVRPEQIQIPTDIILDCAAVFNQWNPNIGFVELTRSGTEKFGHTNKPVFVADNGRIKRIETCLGTGESFFRAMAQLGYKNWQDKELVVFGSGKVGMGIILYAQKYGARLTVVTEPESAPTGVCVIDYKNSELVAQAVSKAYAVVTATGKLDALDVSCISEALISSTALLANMGIEDEYGASVPAQRVLMEKMPLNFILEEPTHMKYIDATMALDNEGAVYLLSKSLKNGIIEPPMEIENELLEICRLHGCITDELDLLHI